MNSSLHVLGCRAGAPVAGIAASGYLLETPTGTLLIDCGPGVALEWSKQQRSHDLAAVIISHRHADHCADLLALAFQRLFPQPRPPLPLFGPASLRDVLAGLDALFGISSLPALRAPIASAFTFTPVVPGDQFVAAGIAVDTLAMQHAAPTMALRFSDSRIVYTADGALTDELVRFAHGARTLLAEATYLQASEHDLRTHGHMTAAQAGLLAQRASVSQLVLTHLAADVDPAAAQRQAAQHFAGAIRVAAPGQIIQSEG